MEGFVRCVTTIWKYGLVVAVLLVSLFGSSQISLAHANLPNSALAGISSSSSCPQPPTNLDLTTLSPSQLMLYGLPQRPKAPASLTHWANQLRHAKHRFCDIVSTSVRHTWPTMYRPSSIQPDYINEQESLNWSGAVAINGGYQDAQAHWVQPNIFGIKGLPIHTFTSIWVGIGGDPNFGGGPIVQAGIEADNNSQTGGVTPYAWFEDTGLSGTLGGAQMVPWQTAPGAGDEIDVDVYNGVLISGYFYIYYGIDDPNESEFTGLYFSESQYTLYNGINYPPFPPSNGSTAEWIVERPVPPNPPAPPPPLLEFRDPSGCPNNNDCLTFCPTTLNPCTAIQNNNTLDIGQLPTWSVVMVPQLGSSRNLCFPGPIHNNVFFNEYWQSGT